MKKFIKNLWEKAEKQGRLQRGRKKNGTILKKTVVIAGKMVYNEKREVALTERRSEKAEDTILFGKYRISRVIGRGRSGTVFLARHLGLDEDRAIKRVPRTGAEIAGEAELLKKLRHPGIPVIYDLESDANYFYLIEEYLDGESLRALVEREGSLTKARRIQFGIELCQIIDYLHSSESNPILYLDLQPGNILICRGTLKLIDFDRAVFASRAGALKAYYGTRGFAAPEQYDGGPLDVRTDIYAIGALLFYMGTGRFPREEDAAEAAGSAEKLTAVTGRCLSRRKEARYQNVSEVLEALKELERGTVLTREERRNDGPLLRVAAAASRSGAGATSLALAAASFLEGLGISCLYREKNGTGAVRKMAAYRNGVPDDYGIFHMRGLALKPEYGPFVKLCEPVFSAVADDYGTGVEAVLEEEYDVIFLLCGAREWEMEDSIRAARLLVRRGGLRLVFCRGAGGRSPALPADLCRIPCFRAPDFSLTPDAETEDFFRETMGGCAAFARLCGTGGEGGRPAGAAGGRKGRWPFLQKGAGWRDLWRRESAR